MRQFQDGDQMTIPKDTFSVRPSDLEQAHLLLESMAKDMAAAFSRAAKAAAKPNNAPATAQQQAAPAKPTAATAATSAGTNQATKPAPLSAANLEKQTQALSKMNQKPGAKGAQPPAAPTSTQPPFQLGATSPHGQPAYIGPPTVTKEDLHIPARKKVKTGQQPTPPQVSKGATPSPHLSKTGSPEVKRQQVPEVKAAAVPQPPPKPMFTCTEPGCDMATTGFATEEARQVHIQEEHIKPAEDPLQFLHDSLTATFGLDINGQALSDQKDFFQPGAVAMGSTPSKQGQTPASNFAATPMSRDASMQRVGSKMGSKPQDTKSAISKADGTPKMDSANRPADATVAPPAPMDLWSNTIDPQSLFLGVYEPGVNGTVSDMNVFRSLTPNDTPESSKDSGSSEPNSDISEGVGLDIDIDWQPLEEDLMYDMNNITMEGFEQLDASGADFDSALISEAMSMPSSFPSWDDAPTDFTKPFSFDNSLYSMDMTS
jgi:hypothetical protein